MTFIDDTLGMEVDQGGLAFLIENMGKDCTFLQMVRELTQNAIEAIQRGDYEQGEVEWTEYPDSSEIFGAPKLCIVDSGTGMHEDETKKYINTFSSSGGRQSFSENFGIGAKIAAATRNKLGVVYESWRDGGDGRGKMSILWKDTVAGKYGLKSMDENARSFFSEVDPARTPQIIRRAGHGTRVTLLGDSDQENTMLPRDTSVKGGGRWLIQYLNLRYFEFPKRISVWAPEALGSVHSQRRQIHGMKKTLEETKAESGTRVVEGGKIHWWILDKDKTELKRNALGINSGHIAALYQNEMYSVHRGRSGISLLQQFGVSVGANRVVIYVEPNDANITSDITRTELKKDGERFPWDRYAEQFRSELPPAIAKLIEDEVAKLEVSSTNLKKLWQKIKAWFDFPSYRKFENGSVSIQPGGAVFCGKSPSDEEAPERPERPEGQGGKNGQRSTKLNSFIRSNSNTGVHGVESEPSALPDLKWIEKPEEHQIEDRVATYDETKHLILANKKFRGFETIVDLVTKDFGGDLGARTHAQQLVRGEYEAVLFQTVLGILTLKETSSGKWSADDVTKALSPEGLTAAVMSRVHQVHQVRRQLGTAASKLEAMAEA